LALNTNQSINQSNPQIFIYVSLWIHITRHMPSGCTSTVPFVIMTLKDMVQTCALQASDPFSSSTPCCQHAWITLALVLSHWDSESYGTCATRGHVLWQQRWRPPEYDWVWDYLINRLQLCLQIFRNFTISSK
jgi:hypothetical protein